MDYQSEEEYIGQPVERIPATSVLSMFDANKEQRMLFASLVVEQLDLGNANPLKVHYQLKCIEKIIELLTDGKSDLSKRYKELLLLEAAKHPGKEFDFGNSTIQVKEFGTRYDWSGCGDTELLQQMDTYEALGGAIKLRQDMLKSVPAAGLETVTTHGEVVTLYPPTKTSTTGISLTLK